MFIYNKRRIIYLKELLAPKCQRKRHEPIYRQFLWTSDRSGILESGRACGVADPHIALKKEYVEFLVGRNGDFDQIVSSAVKRQQRRVRDDNSALIWVLPYPTAELRDNLESFEAYYDEIELCSAAAGSHPKGAIQIRNRQMVDRSDLVVFYVDHSSGGAYQTLRYAQRKEKETLNLVHFGGCG